MSLIPIHHRECELSSGFSLGEKIYAQLTFGTMLVAGGVGLALADWRWLLPYLVLTGYGILGIVMRHQTCPRCPHLHVYGDCLQFPPTWAKRLVKARKTTPFSATERWTFYAIFLLIPAYPLYWLRSEPGLLAVFAVSASMWYLGQWLYLCKRCRVSTCPFNRVREAAPGKSG
jgi:hypothetical protein